MPHDVIMPAAWHGAGYRADRGLAEEAGRPRGRGRAAVRGGDGQGHDGGRGAGGRLPAAVTRG